KEENYRPELYMVPNDASKASDLFRLLGRSVRTLAANYPGLAVQEKGNEARLCIPDVYRVGHEAHFAQVTSRFFEYLNAPESMPAWEKPGMLAKYHVSTRGVEMSASVVR